MTECAICKTEIKETIYECNATPLAYDDKCCVKCDTYVTASRMILSAVGTDYYDTIQPILRVFAEKHVMLQNLVDLAYNEKIKEMIKDVHNSS